MVDVIFDSSHIREAVGNLAISLINAPHGQLTEDLGRFDLVVCFNVVDNCHDPLALVERLQRHTAPGGTIALSCTYQWSKKHLGTTETPTRNICELFDEGWTHLTDTDIEFRFRRCERYWMTFLSHVLVFRKG